MIRALLAFELRRRLRMLSSWVYGLILFAAGLLMMLTSGGVFSSVAVSVGNERIYVNGPQSLFGTISIVALLGIFTVAAIFGQAAHEDFAQGTFAIIFTKNVRKTPYLVGRFLGAFVFAAVLFLAIGLGQLVGSFVVKILHPENLGPTVLRAYLWPYLIQVWPMLFFTGTLFFALAAITRRMAPVYVGAVVLVLGYLVTTTLTQDVDNRTLAALLDPFGFGAFGQVTRYWTPAEQNHDFVPLVSLFGANRAIWTVVGASLLAVAITRFRITIEEHRGGAGSKAERSDDRTPIPVVTPSGGGWIGASAVLARMYFREIIRSAVFWALVVSAVFFGTIIVLSSKDIFGTATLPVTYRTLELTVGGFRLFMLIVIIFYAGELVWRERDVRVEDVFDSTRAPTWVGFLAKLGALLMVTLAMEGASAIVALVAQMSRGYFAIEGKLYLSELLLIDYTKGALVCVFALFVQILVNHKYVGHAVMVVYYVLNLILQAVGVEEPLVRYASESSTPYSDMNGYGHFLGPFLWFRLYWSGFAIVLAILAYVFFVRGRETSLRARWQAGRRRIGGAALVAVGAGILAAAVGGSVIVYNTRVRNEYRTAKEEERRQAEYEKKYKSEEGKPQPTIIGAEVAVDLFPAERRFFARGTYRLKNKTVSPIAQVMIGVTDPKEIKLLTVGGVAAPSQTDERLDVRFYDLPRPLAPGDETDLAYEIDSGGHGFRHGEPDVHVVENGTFFNNGVFPFVGYQPTVELVSDRDRKQYDLAPRERMAPRDDPKEILHNYIRRDSDFIGFAATVSTSADQIAVAPGYLEKEWTEGGRHYFRYAMDHPILNFFSFLSARYVVDRDEHEGIKLEIYRHPSHGTNVGRMMQGMKDALSYCNAAFGPYQHRQARILEFPRYATFAQAFPNTVPYSEGVGFIARVRDDDPEDVDYPYYITAHEIAHQWWAHQVVGANVRGATMTSESMAQYSALMVMKKKYGKTRMRRYLKFELDGYLRGRFTEKKKELPLALNENQGYIHYQKGSIAMYALQDYIGEDRVNRALARVVSEWKFKGPPYARSIDLVDAFRAETPPELAYLIDDLFETITLYDNRVKEAKVAARGADVWEVTMKVVARKVRSDDKGNQTDLDFEDPIDVGALDDKGTAIHVEKQRIRRGESDVRFEVRGKKPAKVGIDPLNGLIDRDSDDNVIAPSG